MTKSELCVKCGECCKFIAFEIPKPLPHEIPTWKAWIPPRGITLLREREKWWRIKIPFVCPNLDTSCKGLFLCKIYGKEEYPEVCKRFDGRLNRMDGLDCAWVREKPED